MRVVPLSASSDATQLLRPDPRAPARSSSPSSRTPGETRALDVTLTGESPLWLLLASGLCLVALAAHERFAGRLAASGRRGLEEAVRRQAPAERGRRARLRRRRRRAAAARARRRAGTRARSGTTTYATARTPESSLWQPDEVVPGGLARRLLAVDDDVLLPARDPGRPPQPSGDAGVHRPGLHRSAGTRRPPGSPTSCRATTSRHAARGRRTCSASLSFADAIADYENRGKLLASAAGRFRQAIALDPANDEAKFNLETVLSSSRGLELAESGGGTNPSPGGKGARGAGAGDPGSGY